MSCPRCMEASGLCKDCEEALFGEREAELDLAKLPDSEIDL
jgi:hypothetical protein